MNQIYKRGMAIPMVLLFVVVILTLMFSMTASRTSVKRQNLSTHTQKKAYYIAQGGIQHALLKLRILPREAYDAGSLARGVCPFFNTYGSRLISGNPDRFNNIAADIFMGDLTSGKVPLTFTFQPGETNWRYQVTKFTVSNYYTSATPGADLGTIYQVVHIEALGYANDPRDSISERTEFVSKQIELERKIN